MDLCETVCALSRNYQFWVKQIYRKETTTLKRTKTNQNERPQPTKRKPPTKKKPDSLSLSQLWRINNDSVSWFPFALSLSTPPQANIWISSLYNAKFGDGGCESLVNVVEKPSLITILWATFCAFIYFGLTIIHAKCTRRNVPSLGLSVASSLRAMLENDSCDLKELE